MDPVASWSITYMKSRASNKRTAKRSHVSKHAPSHPLVDCGDRTPPEKLAVQCIMSTISSLRREPSVSQGRAAGATVYYDQAAAA